MTMRVIGLIVDASERSIASKQTVLAWAQESRKSRQGCPFWRGEALCQQH